MSTQIISHFAEKPRTKAAWWAMGLGFGTIVLGGPTLGVFAAVISPMLSRVMSEKIAGIIGFVLVVVTLTVPVIALIASICAFRKGERSWVLWLGFVPAMLVGAFWVFMIIGEFVFPH